MADTGSHEFDWVEDAGDVVIQAQAALAVYPGPGGVVIRRQADEFDEMYGHGDGVISFSVEHAPAIAAAILDAAALAPKPARAGSQPKDGTGAERQRRRRARQKKEPEPALFNPAVTRDADRDSVTLDEPGA